MTCCSLDCPLINYCRDYDFLTDRGEKCTILQKIIGAVEKIKQTASEVENHLAMRKENITMNETTEIYRQETKGKKWNKPIVTKNNTMNIQTDEGEVIRYNVYSPMMAKQFRALPISARQNYVNALQRTYGCTCTDFTKMLGVDNSHFKERFGVSMAKVKPMNTVQRKAWEEFLKQSKHETEAAVEEITPKPTPQELYLEKIADITNALHTIKAMCETQEDCSKCPCSINNDECLFTRYIPSDWQITEPTIKLVTVK